MKKLKEYAEAFSVAIILIFVLLPVRILFVRYVADDWLGSFGLITAISVLIIILAKKDKLGWFGRAFTRQMFKVHRGKRRIFVYSQLVFGFAFFAGAIYAIEIGDLHYSEQKQELIDALEIQNIEEFVERSENEIKIEDLPLALFMFFYIILFRFDIFAIVISTLNDISDGWMLHFCTVFLVEEMELIGILILTKFVIKKPLN